MQSLSGTAALDQQTWAIIIPMASSVSWLVELEKIAIRRFIDRNQPAPPLEKQETTPICTAWALRGPMTLAVQRERQTIFVA